ncbi:acyl-CoA thioesterase [Antarcticibacterium arcticum]|uniref:Acyl-CoA thioesterase n=1 Tax=Antarcticibacterium arcticum TaxID=2585771 RepID=A0A5B8YGT6_9FLAO|nr:thioesterase family protein [Antarcticibacterium arcticum]QED36994.1 acyl-CoA thioesterase [Antarcticibacterium arcticum]
MPEAFPLKTRTTLRVRFHECDPLQIVWHGNYLKYFEEGREDFGRKHGISYHDAQSKGIAMPIVRSVCEHKLPLKYGDIFEVESTYIDSGAAKILFQYKIFKDEKLVCTGETMQVFLNDKGEMLLSIPPFFLDWKQKTGLL